MTNDPDRCDLLSLDLPHAEAVRAVLPGAQDLTAAAAVAKALGDPTRLRVAAALSGGGAMCGCDLAWITQLAPNLVSHHLRQLRTAGLATSTRRGKLVMYDLTDHAHALLEAVVGLHRPAAQTSLEARAGRADAAVSDDAAVAYQVPAPYEVSSGEGMSVTGTTAGQAR
ncbi:helix-turn-helix transcriptional regulator [uncultured Pseudokineococcus sp.]|uniref:ArsR/SmtB family transcription factor n=1 Tax=uncultured Pseudokineococcus sp. TaxID=1642928 RepID=UPI002637510B|nr:metalloregulator ArsR/SmtB family transcription factor [uncultured Pseudokineococcus sp.]